MATPLTKKRFQDRIPGARTVDEPINRFMTEPESMRVFEIPAALLRADVLTNKLRDQARQFIRALAILVSIGVLVSMFHDLPGPVIGIKMARRIGIPFDFSTAC